MGTCLPTTERNGAGGVQGITRRRSRAIGPGRVRPLVAVLLGLVMATVPGRAQTTGQILGRVIEAETRAPVSTAEVWIENLDLRALTSERGNFLLTGVPVGEYRLQAQRIGFRSAAVPVRVRGGRTTQVTIQLTPAPLELEEVAAEVERARLIEPEVVVTHELVLGRELRELPVDEIEDAVELTTGVSGGHFRGGRVGQESYRIDGLEVRNQLEAARQAPGLELSPSALAEIEVITGGMGADNGSALSGVVGYVTRRGNADRWEGRLALSSDHWVPDALFRGFSSLSASLGGPLHFLGRGSTIFTDVLAQGLIDADPRARGLTCLSTEDADADLAEAIDALKDNPGTQHLYCPFTGPRLPFQRGDKLIGFLRIDRPLAPTSNLTLSLLHNRRQRELYTPEFKYNPDFQLGQRTKAYLASLAIDWTRHREGRAYRLTTRAAAMRLDRYLGVLDPWTFGGRTRIAGFGFADFRFLGEGSVRRPIDEQLESGGAVPGYVEPGGSVGSPFGPAAEGIFFTEGTPEIANWTRTEFVGADLTGEMLSARGHSLRAGASTRFYRIENYERVPAYLPGSLPSYARFFPATAAAFAQVSLLAAHTITVQLGLRVEAFRSGLRFQADRADISAPVIDTRWKTHLMPRVGMAVPVPGTQGRTMFRFNYGLVAQPPDFSFFLDSTIGDSLRTDIRRQGNPNLSFERGASWELGVSHLASNAVALSATAFLKELTNLVTGSLSFSGFAQNQFTTGDFGSVKGLELTAVGRWPGVRVRAGYALQSAKGVTSSAFEDPGRGTITDQRTELPLAFDRRHTADLTVLAGRAVGDTATGWGVSLTTSLRSGFPLDRAIAAGEYTGMATVPARLPWTGVVNLRLTRELGALPGCRACSWRVVAHVRNLLGRDNVIALRRDTGELAPSYEDLHGIAAEVPDDMEPIPRESPRYSPLVDLNRDGMIDAREMETARFAAALDRNDPSLYFGEASQLRLGLEVSF
jgi:hypothetical protein